MKELSIYSDNKKIVKAIIAALIMIILFSNSMGWIKYSISIVEDVTISLDMSFGPFQMSEYAKSMENVLSQLKISDLDAVGYNVINSIKTWVNVLNIISRMLMVSFIMFIAGVCWLSYETREKRALLLCSIGAMINMICSMIYAYIAKNLSNALYALEFRIEPTLWVYLSIISGMAIIILTLWCLYTIRMTKQAESDFEYNSFGEDYLDNDDGKRPEPWKEEINDRFKPAGDL